VRNALGILVVRTHGSGPAGATARISLAPPNMRVQRTRARGFIFGFPVGPVGGRSPLTRRPLDGGETPGVS
jgi:hypothetical protein